MSATRARPRKQSEPVAVPAPAAWPLEAARPLAFPLLMLLAIAIGVFNLWQPWYADPYFAAAVKAMLTSWHNFFYVSFDPAGFISLDKPPLAPWLQAASAKLLGSSEWSLLLPQALAGVFSVALLYYLVRRAFGEAAGLLAGLMLALTPINVAMNRSNNSDSLIVLAGLAGAWAVSAAVESGRLRPLLLCAVAAGLGFNVKWLQGFLVVPAFALLYLIMAPVPRRARALHLALAGAVMLVVALVWAAAVDLTPGAQRPYVGSSGDNSELSLALGYGGLSRLTPGSSVASALAGPIGNAPGEAGPFRLFDAQLGGQIGWLLPLALIGLAVAAYRAWRSEPESPRSRRGAPGADASRDRGKLSRRGSLPAVEETAADDPGLLRRQRAALLLWGGWLLTQGLVFSVADFFHPYNSVVLAPAICALAAVGVVALWREYLRPRGERWLLPAALAGMALAQAGLIAEARPWLPWLIPLVLVLGLAAGAALLLWRGAVGRGPVAATALGVSVLLVAPALWSSVPLWHYGNVELPVAGPDLLDSSIDPPAKTQAFFAPASLTGYLLEHRRGERFILAARYAGVAAPVMLATSGAVLTYGGYLGEDRILSAIAVAQMVARRQVRYFWQLPPRPGQVLPEIEGWVAAHCSVVAAHAWQPAAGYGPNGPRLYDCAGAKNG